MRFRNSSLLSIGVMAVLATAIAVPAAGATDGARSDAKAKHDRIVSFWTNDKVSKAIPRDFAYNPKSGRFEPRKGKPGGGGSSGGTTTGSSWTAGGEVLKTTGKVLFALGSSYYVCSASVVDDTVTERSVILTAGHCAYDETNAAFATNWMFVPDYDSAPSQLDTQGQFCATTSLGCWTASSLVVSSGFAGAGSFNDQAVLHDYAFAVVAAGGLSGADQLDAVVGGQPIQFADVSGGAKSTLFGYPAAGKYQGNDLVYCAGSLGFDSRMANGTYKVSCDMTGGSSGGPWFAPFASGSGTLMSVNSYGYSGVKAMYGPILGTETQTMFEVAAAAAGNTVV